MSDILNQQFQENISVCKASNNIRNYNIPWMNRTALLAVKHKRKAWNKYSYCKNNFTKTRYEEAKSTCNTVVKKAKIEYEKNLAENIKENNKAFWAYVRSKSKTKETIGNLEDSTGEIKSESKEKAEILNAFFTSVFTKENLQSIPDFAIRTQHKLNIIEILSTEVVKNINNLKESKSQGPDGCHPKFLKETIHEIKKPLLTLFKKSLEEGKSLTHVERLM